MLRVKRHGIKRISRNDLYINSLSSSWLRLIFAIILFYVTINAIFAALYLIEDGGIENARAGSFQDAFFFSVQTLATIGYGKMAPATSFTNILVTIEALVGLSGLAVATGVIFSKISRPSTRILFGNFALISLYKNTDCFIFRLGNLRTSHIADPLVKAVFICDELSPEGSIRRAFHDLKLMRNNVPLLMPSWTLRHKIDKDSPLFGMKKEDLERKNIEIIVSLSGFDETLSQTVHTHHSYIASEIKFGGRFVDIMSWDKLGHANVDYKRFHEVE
ncbi:MAG: hypothetical protein KA100_00685 [Rickettsiales bacterium]|nr:hypothetical protein [Rickettsiales bacterium]